VGRPSKPVTEETLIIVPDFWERRIGRAAWMRRRGPKKLVSFGGRLLLHCTSRRKPSSLLSLLTELLALRTLEWWK
jgi:hypothetical protein